MALRGRKIEHFDDISLAAWSPGLPICVSSTSFQKSSIVWPQQPPTERISDIREKLDFWWSISQKGASDGHFGANHQDQEVWTFEFHQPVFKKVTLADLNSLQQKEHQISVKNWIFDDPFHKKGPVLVILVPGMIQPLGSGSSLMT